MRKAGVVLAALVLGVSNPAYAFQSPTRHRYTFYEYAESPNIVGQLVVYCDGSAFQSGVMTAVYDEEHYDCP